MSDNNSLMIDLRKEAEDRANERSGLSSTSSDFSRRPVSLRSRSARLNPVINVEPNENMTPHIAKIAEKDYLLNGSRARAESGEFVPPRWIPDLGTTQCTNCRSEFDWINRRHHCRHCGQIFCERCAFQRLLLPPEFGYRDPERVCLRCHDQLLPLQGYFSTNIANHQRANTVDIASDTCNVRRYFNMPVATTLGSEIRKASYTIYNLLAPQTLRDKAIPLRLIREAKGLAFLTILKGGFGVGAKFGTGLVIARLPRDQGGGWSAPSAIGVMGLTWGFMIGADLTDTLIILNTEEAVQAFAGNAQLTIGADIEVAVGMMGRSGTAEVHVADTQTLAPAFSYSQSKGFYAGVSLDGSILVTRNDVNHKFYGRPVDAAQLLSGEVSAPRAAAPLYTALAEALSAVPDVSHRPPSTTGSPVMSPSSSSSRHNPTSSSSSNSYSSSSSSSSSRYSAAAGGVAALPPQSRASYTVQASDSISNSNYSSSSSNSGRSAPAALETSYYPPYSTPSAYEDDNIARRNASNLGNGVPGENLTTSLMDLWNSFVDDFFGNTPSSSGSNINHNSTYTHNHVGQSHRASDESAVFGDLADGDGRGGYAGYEGVLQQHVDTDSPEVVDLQQQHQPQYHHHGH